MNKVLIIDVILDGVFKMQYGYEFCSLFPIDIEEVAKEIIDKHPSFNSDKLVLDIVCSVDKKDYRKWKTYRKSA